MEKEISARAADERYKDFIDSAKRTRDVYVMYNKARREIALNIDKKNKKYLYLFPDEQSVIRFLDANPDMKKYVPHKWELTFLIDTAIPRLKTENTNDAFVYPAPNGWGFNRSFDRMIDDLSGKA